MLGGEGDDILIGGTGNDNLWGEGGSDTFVWHAGDTGADVIKDFDLAQDKIDLSDLLQGEENASDIGDYIKLSASGDTLLVSSTGSLDATGSNADVSIQLEGVNLSEPSLNLGATPAAIINSLIAGSDPTVKLDH
ncbi:type I secretion C-terminal target domain-containing protein [Pseudomonas sp. J452]|nr:type I secretion C-terminal target domain-containing protein [Pseudomonas sp. J452]